MPSTRQRAGRFSTLLLEQGAQTIQADLHEFVKVFRTPAGGSETVVAEFRTRIAPAVRAVAGRDRPSVQGDTSPEYDVCYAPLGTDIQAGDELWSGPDRFRVFSVDPYPHRSQVLLLNLQ